MKRFQKQWQINGAIKKEKRCKHLNGSLREVMWSEHQRDVDNGEVNEEGYNTILDIDHYTYECYDCEKYYKFKRLDVAPLKFLRETEL